MRDRPWRVIFFGTPEFAVPTLEALTAAGEEVAAVVTQPDRPRGRGQKPAPPPVKVRAQALGLPVLQPSRLKDPAFLAWLAEMAPELLVVAAYGRLLPAQLLALPQVGCLNVHASLLPRYRGAAPVNWALIHGDPETGVTIMWMVEELDAGPVFLQERVAILPEDNAGTLGARLAEVGARLLVAALQHLRRGEVIKIPQPQTGVSYAPPLTPEMQRLDFTREAREVAGWIRGLDPKPGAYTLYQGKRLKLFGGRVAEETDAPAPPGTVLGLTPAGLLIACGRGLVTVQELQWPGGTRLPAAEFLRGRPLVGEILGQD
ncbi:MAG: methionyl-tRNA formyltransferase [Syntrophobacterales bacterium]|nr:methionyl-tRNA formyltransferase [Syntrophobacterales bacterium]